VDNSAKTDQKEQVNTIFEQSPGAGANIPDDKTVRVRVYGSLLSKGPPPPSNPIDQMIPGSDKDLIGNFSGTAQVTTFDFGDIKHEHPQPTAKPISVGISRDDQGQWHMSGRIAPNSGIGEVGGSGASTSVSGGVLTFEQHEPSVDRTCTIKVNGNQLSGTCQNTLKDGRDGSLQPPPISFTATRN